MSGVAPDDCYGSVSAHVCCADRICTFGIDGKAEAAVLTVFGDGSGIPDEIRSRMQAGKIFDSSDSAVQVMNRT